MNRNELFSRLELSMVVLGKEMYQDQSGLHDCSPAQNHVLMVIGLTKDVHTKQLAEQLRVTPGAATQHIDALEKAGLLTRKVNEINRREVVVTLTKKGHDAYKQLRQAKQAMLNDIFMDLTDDELATLVKLVEKVSLKYTKSKGGTDEKV